MNLLNTLIDSWKNNVFANAWIIHSNDSSKALNTILHFCTQIFHFDENLSANTDLMIVEKQPSAKSSSDSKFITVDQVRDMLSFLNKTPIKHNVKVAIISEAEHMNINAANCCLKILEDSSLTNSYIFLITQRLANIIPTIYARCRVVTENFSMKELSSIDTSHNQEYQQLLDILGNSTQNLQLDFIDKIKNSSVNSIEWQNFSDAVIELIIRAIKYKSSVRDHNDISSKTQIIETICASNSINELYKKCDFLYKIINNTNNCELDIRNATILVLSVLQNKYKI